MPSDPENSPPPPPPPPSPTLSEDDDELVPILDPMDDEGFADAREAAAHDAAGNPLVDRVMPEFDIPEPPPMPAVPTSFRRSDSVGPANETVFSVDPTDDFGEYELAPSPEPEAVSRPRPLRTAQPTTVLEEKTCRKCGYSLLGLPADGRCPECGTPIVASGDSDFLVFANGPWLGKLVLGCRLVLWGLVGYAASLIGTFFLGFTISAQGLASDAFALLSAFVSVGLSVMILGGAWLLSTPDPSYRGETEYGRRRKAVRVLACFGLAAALCAGVASLSQLAPTVRLMAESASELLYLPWLAGHGAIAFYLKMVAKRIPEPYLVDRAEFVASALWGSTAALGVIVIGTIVVAFLSRAAGPSGAGAGIACGGCLFTLLLLTLGGFTIVYAVMLEAFARAIDDQRIAGDEIAASPSVTGRGG